MLFVEDRKQKSRDNCNDCAIPKRYKELLQENNLSIGDIFEYKGDTYKVTQEGIFIHNAGIEWIKDDQFLLALFMQKVSLTSISVITKRYFVPDVTTIKKMYKEYIWDPAMDDCYFHLANDLMCETKDEAIRLAESMVQNIPNCRITY